jgi:hypothetical protein
MNYSKGSVIAGKEPSLDGVAGVVVVPGDGGKARMGCRILTRTSAGCGGRGVPGRSEPLRVSLTDSMIWRSG